MQDETGITLVEVLISLLILLVGILAVLTMHTTSVQNNKVAREMTEAMHHANKELEIIIAKDFLDLDTNIYPKQIQSNISNIKYEIDIEADDKDLNNILFSSLDIDDIDYLFAFELIVSWRSFGKEREIVFPFKKSSVGMSPTIN
ncbi:hypothetical protein Dthio_PD3604 [Desulfonatronospira thiodismutans ASO3-1]|uniref:Prepilin-type N-terminal cleavage/methylation domain-containing protein n=1 Tax=Desulfonatronospira thiodismutans ASO3-1 TaxID=555779 RepID=D6SJU7_9BACT|nr:prepilin-type N-terminal cleavage/methylation domain-containing protein [Desulfonatronospira thiodismutans]EFI36150.1 hypothetical protein Dthio_PD3604 [Desulfonatronospira thiodismutans ASO3-1]